MRLDLQWADSWTLIHTWWHYIKTKYQSGWHLFWRKTDKNYYTLKNAGLF